MRFTKVPAEVEIEWRLARVPDREFERLFGMPYWASATCRSVEKGYYVARLGGSADGHGRTPGAAVARAIWSALEARLPEPSGGMG